jgi:hypothetical protein
MNKDTARNTAPAAADPSAGPARPPRGRPRRFADAAAKQRAQRQREGEKRRQVDALLHAVRNARADDPALHRRIQEGDDVAVLAALTEYYRQRHWCTPRAASAPGAGDPTTPSKASREPPVGGKPSE